MVRIFLFGVLVAISCSPAAAGPFGRRVVTSNRVSSCVDGRCSSATARTVVRGGGAQAHAESMAASGSLVHASAHGATYEGVGTGPTPQAALNSCCNNGGVVLEEGVSQGRDGRWFACRRYSLR